MATMGLVALEVQIFSLVWITTSRPSLDRPVIPSSADLRLRRAPSTGENNRSHDVEMTPECKADLKLARIASKATTRMRC